MSIFDKYENFIYLNDGTLSKEEEEEEEKKRQEQLCELMYEYQQYKGIIKQQQYVLRGSKLQCQYGTRRVLLDCLEDYGICKSGFPFLTTQDCKIENIHNFGSCLCPEKNYLGRLPMTVERDKHGKLAKKASCNVFSHICVPLIDEEHGWRQIDTDLLVEVNAQGYAPMLLDNAVLVCQYGGIITIEEVPETEEEAASMNKKEKYVVISKVLNVRDGASTEDEVIGRLKAGDRVYVTDSSRKKEETKDGERLWAKIEYEDEEAWVDDSSILPDEPVVTENFPQTVGICVNGKETTEKLNWGINGNGGYKEAPEMTDGRYNIAVGPKIMNPKYSDEGLLQQEEFMAFTREIDVVVKHKKTKEEKVIECYEFDLKAHSYNRYPDERYPDAYKGTSSDKVLVDVESGILQTGIRYPHATNGTEYAAGNVDISVIEFCHSSTGGINCDDYELVKVIAYLKEEQGE